MSQFICGPANSLSNGVQCRTFHHNAEEYQSRQTKYFRRGPCLKHEPVKRSIEPRLVETKPFSFNSNAPVFVPSAALSSSSMQSKLTPTAIAFEPARKTSANLRAEACVFVPHSASTRSKLDPNAKIFTPGHTQVDTRKPPSRIPWDDFVFGSTDMDVESSEEDDTSEVPDTSGGDNAVARFKPFTATDITFGNFEADTKDIKASSLNDKSHGLTQVANTLLPTPSSFPVPGPLPSPKPHEIVEPTPEQREASRQDFKLWWQPYAHHFNFFGDAVPCKSATSPATSLAIILGEPKFRDVWRSKKLYKTCLLWNASLFIDPVWCNAPIKVLKTLKGSKLENAVIGQVCKFYTGYGSWPDDNWEEDDDFPVLDDMNKATYPAQDAILNGYTHNHSLPTRRDYFSDAEHENIVLDSANKCAIQKRIARGYKKSRMTEVTTSNEVEMVNTNLVRSSFGKRRDWKAELRAFSDDLEDWADDEDAFKYDHPSLENEFEQSESLSDVDDTFVPAPLNIRKSSSCSELGEHRQTRLRQSVSDSNLKLMEDSDNATDEPQEVDEIDTEDVYSPPMSREEFEARDWNRYLDEKEIAKLFDHPSDKQSPVDEDIWATMPARNNSGDVGETRFETSSKTPSFSDTSSEIAEIEENEGFPPIRPDVLQELIERSSEKARAEYIERLRSASASAPAKLESPTPGAIARYEESEVDLIGDSDAENSITQTLSTSSPQSSPYNCMNSANRDSAIEPLLIPSPLRLKSRSTSAMQISFSAFKDIPTRATSLPTRLDRVPKSVKFAEYAELIPRTPSPITPEPIFMPMPKLNLIPEHLACQLSRESVAHQISPINEDGEDKLIRTPQSSIADVSDLDDGYTTRYEKHLASKKTSTVGMYPAGDLDLQESLSELNEAFLRNLVNASANGVSSPYKRPEGNTPCRMMRSPCVRFSDYIVEDLEETDDEERCENNVDPLSKDRSSRTLSSENFEQHSCSLPKDLEKDAVRATKPLELTIDEAATSSDPDKSTVLLPTVIVTDVAGISRHETLAGLSAVSLPSVFPVPVEDREDLSGFSPALLADLSSTIVHRNSSATAQQTNNNDSLSSTISPSKRLPSFKRTRSGLRHASWSTVQNKLTKKRPVTTTNVLQSVQVNNLPKKEKKPSLFKKGKEAIKRVFSKQMHVFR